MGKSRKSTNNNANNSNCYVLLSRVGTDDVGSKPEEEEVAKLAKVEVVNVNETDITPLNLTSFEQIRDATMESNEFIKELIYNVHKLRQEVAELTKYVTNRGAKN